MAPRYDWARLSTTDVECEALAVGLNCTTGDGFLMDEVSPKPIDRHRVDGGMIVFPVAAFHLPSLPSFRAGYNMGVNLIGMAGIPAR